MDATGAVSPAVLVARLGTGDWEAARDRLDDRLERDDDTALEAVLDGMNHADPDVRKWCVALMDHHATPRCVPELVDALEDPAADVRRHAVHGVGCQSCKPDPLDLDVVGLLIERIRTDSSIRVRRAAAHMLGNQPPSDRARAFLAGLVDRADDGTLRRNARWALDQHRR